MAYLCLWLIYGYYCKLKMNMNHDHEVRTGTSETSVAELPVPLRSPFDLRNSYRYHEFLCLFYNYIYILTSTSVDRWIAMGNRPKPLQAHTGAPFLAGELAGE
jgi:hypothetical protein